MAKGSVNLQPRGLRIQQCWEYVSGVSGNSGRNVFEQLKARYPDIVIPFYRSEGGTKRLECYRTDVLDAAMAAEEMRYRGILEKERKAEARK